MDATRGQIIDYDETDSDGNVLETLPMLVVHVNDTQSVGKDPAGNDVPNDSFGAVVGIVFTTAGSSYPVTIPAKPAPAPVDSTPVGVQERGFSDLTPDERKTVLREEIDSLSPDERELLIEALGPNPAPTPTPEPTPTPTPTPPPPVPTGTAPAPFEQ